MHKRWFVSLLFVATAGCGTSEVACSYEYKNDSSCSDGTRERTDWKFQCATLDEAEVCERITTSQKLCDSYGNTNCCVDWQYRNVTMENGSCSSDEEE